MLGWKVSIYKDELPPATSIGWIGGAWECQNKKNVRKGKWKGKENWRRIGEEGAVYMFDGKNHRSRDSWKSETVERASKMHDSEHWIGELLRFLSLRIRRRKMSHMQLCVSTSIAHGRCLLHLNHGNPDSSPVAKTLEMQRITSLIMTTHRCYLDPDRSCRYTKGPFPTFLIWRKGADSG